MTSDDAVIADVSDGRIYLTSSFRRKEAIKLIPGARWDRERNQWWMPISWPACKQLRGVFGTDLVVGEGLVAWAQNELATRINPSLQLRLATEWEDTLNLDPRLRPFQVAGVHFLVTAKQAILGDEMGAGKTVQLVQTLKALDETGGEPFPALIVCPSSIKAVWLKEFREWYPTASVVVAEGGAAARKKAIASGADVVIINYESAWRHTRLKGYGNLALTDAEKTPKELNEVEWRTIITDEAHRTKNARAKQTRAVWWLGQKAEYRYALTGTPIANAPDDLWSLLHFVAPHEFPSKTAFVDRYCNVSFDGFGHMNVIGVHPVNKDELFEILDPRFRRMPKSLVLPQLPPKVRVTREVAMSPKQAKAYRQMETMMMADFDGDIVAETLPITKRLRLMQFASASAEVDAEDRVRLTAPSSKIDEMVDYLTDIGEAEPAVIFAQSRQLIELACQRLDKEKIQYRKVVGGMSTDERANAVRDFQEGRCRVFLGTVAAAGEGLTLTRSRHLAFLQRADSMLMNLQAEDRIHRIGSEIHDSVVITDFIATGTVEEPQLFSLFAKIARLQEIVRDRVSLELAAQSGDASAIQKLQEFKAEEARILGSTL